MRKWVIVGIAAAVAAAGTVAVVRVLEHAAVDAAAGLAPPDAILYVNVWLDPSSDQKRGLRDLLAAFDDAGEPVDLEDLVVEFVDRELLADAGLTFADDVEPWAGRQVALYFTRWRPPAAPEEGAILIETESRTRALRTVRAARAERGLEPPEERTHRGVDYGVSGDTAFGVVEGFLVVGTPGALEGSIDAAEGSALADTPRYADVVGPLSDDVLGLVYADSETLLDAFVDGGDAPVARAGLATPMALALHVTPDALVLEQASVRPGDDETGDAVAGDGSLGDMPADAWAALSTPGLGDLARTLVAGDGGGGAGAALERFEAQSGIDVRDEVLPWLTDVSLFVRGESLASLSGGIVMHADEPEGPRRFVDRLRGLAVAFGGRPRPVERRGRDGFAVQGPGQPAPIYVLGGDGVVIAWGDGAADAALGEGPRLGGTAKWEAAAGSLGDFDPRLYVDVPAAVELVDVLRSFEAPVRADESWRSLVAPLSYAIVGARRDGDALVHRMVIGVR